MKINHNSLSFFLYFFLLIGSLFAPINVMAEGAVGYEAPKGERGSQRKDNLTDQEYMTSKTYVHEGLLQRQHDEACKGMERECRGREAEGKFLGLDSNIIKMVAKCYSMILPMMDMMGSSSQKEDSKSGSDYCKFIPMATEMIASFQQQLDQKNIETSPTSPGEQQKESLYKAARSHKARAKNSKIQMGGWGAASACYVGLMVYNGVAGFDYTVLIKLAAAGFLTAFFQSEVQRHMKAYKKVKSIADKLPGPGTCNPITERNCYCAQPETENDPKYCLKEMHKRHVKENSLRVTCLNNKLKADPQCACITQDNCYDKTYETMLKNSGWGTAFRDNAYKSIKNLTRGEMKGASLNNQASANKKSAALLKKLKEYSKKHPFKGNLTKTQLKDAKDMSQLGLPLNLSKHLVASPTTPEMKKTMANLKNKKSWARKVQPKYVAKARSRVLTFSGGDGLSGKKKKSGDKFNPFAKLFKKKKKRGKASTSILNFAERAQNAAQINRSKDRHIFEIISRRYKISASKRLEIKE